MADDDLKAHVAACNERYKTIFDRLNRIEQILWNAIKGTFALGLAIIGGLISVVVLLLTD